MLSVLFGFTVSCRVGSYPMDEPGARYAAVWENALYTYEKAMSFTPNFLQFRLECTLGLARYCHFVPEDVLSRAIPLLAHCLSNEYDFLTPSKAIQVASIHCLTRIACHSNGRLAANIGHSGAIGYMVRLTFWAVFHSEDNGFSLRLILKCLAVLVSFRDECRVVLYEENGLQIIPMMFRFRREDIRPYLLEIMSAMSMLEDFRKGLIGEGGLGIHCLIAAASVGSSMVSRERACQAIGLLGVSKEERHFLFELDAIPVLVDLFRNGDGRTKFVAANALGVLSSHEDYIKATAQAGAIPLYAELLQGPDPIGREIAEDAFCLLAVDKLSAVLIAEHAARILREGDDGAKFSAADVLWNVAFHNHSAAIVRNTGVIPILVQLLRDGSLCVKKKVSGVIAVLSYNKGDRDALADAGAIPIIACSMYDDEEDEMLDLFHNCTEALAYLYEDPDYECKVVEAAGRWFVEDMWEDLDIIYSNDFTRQCLRQIRRLLGDPDIM